MWADSRAGERFRGGTARKAAAHSGEGRRGLRPGWLARPGPLSPPLARADPVREELRGSASTSWPRLSRGPPQADWPRWQCSENSELGEPGATHGVTERVDVRRKPSRPGQEGSVTVERSRGDCGPRCVKASCRDPPSTLGQSED